MSEVKPTARQLIAAAIAAAGKGPAVARAMGIEEATVRAWAARSRVPADRIHRLCQLGNYTIRPEALLEAIGREAENHEMG